MSQVSPILTLPLLQPSQAQKHVTHNEALHRLDVLAQLTVAAFDAADPPADPEEGAVYALGAAPGGAWAGHADQLAARIDGAWLFLAPRPGWRAWGLAEAELRIWDGTGWAAMVGPLEELGIGTAADATNRLALRAPGALFTHAGAGHRLTLNKASPADTASLVLQSDWTGHAEIGLAGNIGLSFKVSSDGVAWTEALRFDPDSGVADGAAVQNGPGDTTAGRLMRADYGYGPGNLLGTVDFENDLPSGAVIEQGETAAGRYARFADGTQVCTRQVAAGSVSSSSALNGFHRSDLLEYAIPRSFAGDAACAVSRASPGGGGLIAEVGHDTAAGWRVRFMAPSAFNGVAHGAFTLLAVGRWR